MTVRLRRTLKSWSILATMTDTTLAEAPTTPAIGFSCCWEASCDGGLPSPHSWTSLLNELMYGRMNSSACSRAYVSLRHVSRIWQPSVMPGNSVVSLLIRSIACSIASARWIPFSPLIVPQICKQHSNWLMSPRNRANTERVLQIHSCFNTSLRSLPL